MKVVVAIENFSSHSQYIPAVDNNDESLDSSISCVDPESAAAAFLARPSVVNEGSGRHQEFLYIPELG